MAAAARAFLAVGPVRTVRARSPAFRGPATASGRPLSPAWACPPARVLACPSSLPQLPRGYAAASALSHRPRVDGPLRRALRAPRVAPRQRK
eukprot:1388909-Pleurochrysis_carterae.AAC.2